MVLAGPNGSGKSSVLELISLALSQMWSLTYSLNRSAPESSFEVTIGLLPHELELIQNHQVDLDAEAIEYLTANHSYCRAFKYEDGEYAANAQLHNKAHSVVQAVLKDSGEKPLGFFLGADRTYNKSSFNSKNIFNYKSYTHFQTVWNLAFQPASKQYEDMFNFLVTWRYHFTRRLGTYHLKLANGQLDDPNEQPPVDEYGKILAEVFPEYQFVDKDEDAPSDLFIRIPSGETIPFSDLSSGEKEVFFTLCFFQRHEVEDAVLVIDEPELHLHPSLARLLLRTMMSVKPRNQIWLATQSSEIIDEAGRDRVTFIRRGEDGTAEVIPATEEEEALGCLRNFFGQSGYIGLAKAFIFIEGQNSGTDRKMFAKLFPHSAKDIKVIPAGGCSEVERINRAVLLLIENRIAWCKFLLVRDRDYLEDQMVANMRQRMGNSFFVLEKHEIENYLINFELMSTVLADYFDTNLSAAQVRERLHSVARNMAGNVLRDMVAFRLNLAFQPEDFSIPQLLQDDITCAEGGQWTQQHMQTLENQLKQRSQNVVQELSGRIQGHQFDQFFEQCKTEVANALQGDHWLNLFPGKELITRFCQELQIGRTPIFQNAIIKEMSSNRQHIPAEINQIINAID